MTKSLKKKNDTLWLEQTSVVSTIQELIDIAVIRGLSLHDLDFEGASLVGSKFDGSDLSRCSFRGADLHGSTFRGAKMRGVRLPRETESSRRKHRRWDDET